MGFNPALRRKTRVLTEEKMKDITLNDVFRSSELQKFFSSLAEGLKGGDGTAKTINIIQDDPGETARTNGSVMTINSNSELITSRGNPESQFLALCGFFFHEKAHDLFMDWNLEKIAYSYLEKGLLYGQKPSGLTAEEDATLTDMMLALSDPVQREIFMVAFQNISNIIADVHDEEAMIDYLGDYAGEPILVIRAALRESCSFFEDMEQSAANGSKLAMFFNMLLQMCRFGDVMTYDHDAVVQSEYWQVLEKIRWHAEIACVTDDTMRKFSEMNYIMLYLWPFIKQESHNKPDRNQQSGNDNGEGDDNATSGNSGGQAGGQSQSNGGSNPQNSNAQSGNQPQPTPLTPEQVQKILKALQDGAKNSGATKSQDNKKSSNTAVQNRSAAKDSGDKSAEGNNPPQGPSNINMVLDTLMKQIAQNQAEHELELESSSDVLAQVLTADQTSPHSGIKINAHRELNVTQRDVDTWNMAMKDLVSVSKRAQRQLLAELRDLNEGYTDKRKVFGKHLDVNDAYRLDCRCFSTKKAPEDYPDMAVSLLIDLSGSMSGARLNEARKAAMLVHDFCTGINIPVGVAGHSVTKDNAINYYIYAEHESIGKNDKYRLSKLFANGCNRDGAAINVSASILRKRPERIKLLLIISDGQPNDRGYGGTAAAEDIRTIISNCRKHGIEVVAAAIGDDQENIKKIYADNYLNISDLNRLPKELIKIIRKRIINAAF